MLGRIVRMLTGGGLRKELERSGLFASRAQQAAFRKLEAAAPLVTEPYKPPVHVVTESSAPLEQTDHSILRREAVLSRKQRVAGYIFSLVYKANPRVVASSTSIQRLYDKVLLRNLQGMEVRRILEHRLAFVDVSASSLELPFIEEMPAQGTVYVLAPSAGLGAHHEACLARLKSRGFRVGLRVSGAHTVDSVPFLELMDFLLIDVGNSDLPSIKDQMTVAVGRAPKMKFVATNLQTLEEYQACSKLPFALFQGAFITSREKLDVPVLDAGRLRILELLNKLRGDSEVAELAALIKQNVALAYKLLRYINSPGMGLTQTIVTPEQALMVLGRKNLYRWLTILLFTSGKTPGLDWAVMENALIRARLAELIAQKSKTLDSDERDELFVAGLFSLLDVVLSTPLDTLLRQVKLPDPVSEALLVRQGKYAPYLALAIACEESDEADIASLAHAVGLDPWRVNAYHLEAMVWAQQVGSTE